MARYDSPGYLDQLPGFPPRSSHDYMSPPGSPPAGTSQPQTTVSSGLPGSGVVMDQHGSAAVTQPGQYPDREPFSGLPLGGSTGAGQGSAGHHRHPNASGREAGA